MNRRRNEGLNEGKNTITKILITGGAGFIGSHLADELLAHGYQISALDTLSPQVHGPSAWRPADQQYYVSDPHKFSAATGWPPKISVRDGLTKLFNWLQRSRAARCRPLERQRKKRTAHREARRKKWNSRRIDQGKLIAAKFHGHPSDTDCATVSSRH
jgi:hypothetical protein